MFCMWKKFDYIHQLMFSMVTRSERTTNFLIKKNGLEHLYNVDFVMKYLNTKILIGKIAIKIHVLGSKFSHSCCKWKVKGFVFIIIEVTNN